MRSEYLKMPNSIKTGSESKVWIMWTSFTRFNFIKNDFSGLSGLGWRSFDDFWTRTTILYISKRRKVRSRVGKFHRCWKCLFSSKSSTNGIKTGGQMETFHYKWTLPTEILAFGTFQLFHFSNYIFQLSVSPNVKGICQ